MAQNPSADRPSVRQFVRSRLRWQLWLLLFAAICAIVLSLTVLISRMMQRYARGTVIATSENLVYQGAQNLENYLHNVETLLLVPYSNSALYQRLSTDSAPGYELDSYVNLTLKASAVSDPTIYQAHLYADSQHASYLVRSSVFSKSNVDAAPEQHQLWIEPLHQSSNYGVDTVKRQQPQDVVSLHRTLWRVPEDTYIGQIDIDLTTDYLDSVMQKLKTNAQETVCLLLSDGTPVFAPDAPSCLTAQTVEALPDTGGHIELTDSSSATQLLFYSPLSLECGTLYLLKITPAAVLSAGTTQLIRLTWLIAFIVLLVSSAALFIISARFTAPIVRLVQHMERIGQGDMTDPISTTRIDEIGRLITQFQTMMDNINALILQRYQLELSNKSSQLLAMQAQLNPHFINNTIQSIGVSALQAGNREIYTQLAGFGSLMQYCMDFESSQVPLSQEIAFAEHYLYFQKLRFPDLFVYSVQAPPELLELPVPKMLLQPLVENAFVHGHLQNRTNGFLLLTVSADGPMLTITVEDNGAGADEASLQRLRAELADAGADLRQSDHIGICTTCARLRLYYGESAAIDVQNRPRGGFLLTLRLPRKENEHEGTDC